MAATHRLARSRGLGCVVVTFSPRPEAYFRPDTALPDICTVEDRVTRLTSAGADAVVVLPFSSALAAMPCEEFVHLLRTHLQMQLLSVGADFALGRDRAGTPTRLRELGLDVFEHELLPNALGTAKASSTSIRRAIATGMHNRAALAQG